MSNFRFGNRAAPGSGIVVPWLDLNDEVAWYTTEFIPQPATLLDLAQQNWRGQSSRIAGDKGPLKLDLKCKFDESGAGRVLAVDQAKLSESGEQWLQISATQQILVEYADFKPSSLERPGSGSKVYGVAITLMARKGYAEDMNPSTGGPVNLGGSTGAGTQTNFNIAYAGAVRTRPVFTLTIPNTNTVTITTFKLQNTDSGEILTVNFSPALLANTAYTITIDTDAYSIIDGSGVNYDPVGSFPKLYPPAGTTNHFTATVVTGSGTSTGITLSYSYTNHWQVQA